MRIIFTALLSMLFLVSIGQFNILNPGFETWTGSGATIEPTNWNSNRTGTGNATSGPQTCFQETNNPRSGTYCARVQTGSTFGVVVNGSLTTGRVNAPSFNKSEGYISSITSQAPDFIMPFSGRPDSLIFWYRYNPSGTDYFSVTAFLHVSDAYSPEVPVNNNHPNTSANIIARATYQSTTATVNTWTRVAIPFVYVDNRTPQYILIATTSSGDQTGGVSGTRLYLDDFDVFYQPTLITNTINPLAYFVSATQGAQVTVPFSIVGSFQSSNIVTAQLSDASGAFTSPINIGTSTTNTSGSITATIPAGTASGTAYRIRTTSTAPALTANNNGADISISLVSNSIAPTTTQTIASNTNGNTLTVTETAGALSRAWKYSTSPGGPYVSVSPAASGTTYAPRFNIGGTFYVVCETTYPGGVSVISNEVEINVIGNSITPPNAQSIAVGTNGSLLTVNETATATSREWKFSTTTGGPYSAFTPSITGTTYIPNFGTTGTYFVICESVINGINVVSNEVEIEVFTPILLTGTIAGSPFEFSVSAPNALVDVPYTTTSAVFNFGNIFTAQLSDANGSFANPTVIGQRTDVSSGIINATIPSNTPSGLFYRIRVVSSNQAVTGSNNGVDLIINQFSNSISPTASQTILYNTNGTDLTVTPSQTSIHEWKFSTTPGGPYTAITPAQTGSIYTPRFATPGTYYVVCCSRNQYNDEVCSNEVEIIVTNGSVLSTSTIVGSPFLVSPKANVTLNVPFTSDIIFGIGNTFTAELSDATGSFASPTVIGTLNSTSIAPVPSVIPNTTLRGTQYRIRVTASNPATIGTDNGVDLEVIPFEISISPPDTQFLFINVPGNPVTVTESHPATRNWLFSQFSGFSYGPFSPAATNTTYAPTLPNIGTYYMICRSVNAVLDTVTSSEVVLILSRDTTSIDNTKASTTQIFQSGENIYIWRDENTLVRFRLYDITGKVILDTQLNERKTSIPTQSLARGVYLFDLENARGKFIIR